MPRTLTAPTVTQQLPTDAATRFQHHRLFTASGTFTVPAGVTKVWVSAWGGGGGGRSLQSGTWYGNGGNGGDGCYRVPVTVTPGANITVTVGAGGNGGSSATAGGTTSFGSAISVNGGAAANSSPTVISQYVRRADSYGLPVEGMFARGGIGDAFQPSSNSGPVTDVPGGFGAFGSQYGAGGRSDGNGSAGAVIVEW